MMCSLTLPDLHTMKELSIIHNLWKYLLWAFSVTLYALLYRMRPEVTFLLSSWRIFMAYDFGGDTCPKYWNSWGSPSCGLIWMVGILLTFEPIRCTLCYSYIWQSLVWDFRISGNVVLPIKLPKELPILRESANQPNIYLGRQPRTSPSIRTKGESVECHSRHSRRSSHSSSSCSVLQRFGASWYKRPCSLCVWHGLSPHWPRSVVWTTTTLEPKGVCNQWGSEKYLKYCSVIDSTLECGVG